MIAQLLRRSVALPAATFLLAATFLPSSAPARSAGPPDGRTNAPGEGNCTECHTSFPLNSGLGSFQVSDLSDWVPGQTYDLGVVLSDPNASRWGFELTILDGAGVSAGTLATVDANTQLSTTGARDYAKHTSAGTQNGTTGSGSWTLQWTAPLAGTGGVTLYAAGNAANGNGASSGDRIYTTASSWAEGGPSAAPLPALAGSKLMPNYPNPFNPRTTLAFELMRDQFVELSIYAVNGRLIGTLISGPRAAGPYAIHWDGLDRAGREVPSGSYIARLRTPDGVQAQIMTLVR